MSTGLRIPTTLELILKLLAFAIKAKQLGPAVSYAILDDKDKALINLKRKRGAVVVDLGTRDTGKTELAYRIAEFLEKPTYAVSPEQNPHPDFIQRIRPDEVNERVPPNSTIIFDDMPAYASNRDYNEALVREMEKIIPMCRHERKLHLIFASQSAAQADKYILDCDMAFLKPLGLLSADVERPHIKRIYETKVNQYFVGKSDAWTHRHAYMMCRSWEGLISIAKVTNPSSR